MPTGETDVIAVQWIATSRSENPRRLCPTVVRGAVARRTVRTGPRTIAALSPGGIADPMGEGNDIVAVVVRAPAGDGSAGGRRPALPAGKGGFGMTPRHPGDAPSNERPPAPGETKAFANARTSPPDSTFRIHPSTNIPFLKPAAKRLALMLPDSNRTFPVVTDGAEWHPQAPAASIACRRGIPSVMRVKEVTRIGKR